MYLSPYFHNDPPPETSLRSGLQLCDFPPNFPNRSN